jgi:hypothetical protein
MVNIDKIFEELGPEAESGKISHELSHGWDPRLSVGYSYLGNIFREIESKLNLEPRSIVICLVTCLLTINEVQKVSRQVKNVSLLLCLILETLELFKSSIRFLENCQISLVYSGIIRPQTDKVKLVATKCVVVYEILIVNWCCFQVDFDLRVSSEALLSVVSNRRLAGEDWAALAIISVLPRKVLKGEVREPIFCLIKTVPHSLHLVGEVVYLNGLILDVLKVFKSQVYFVLLLRVI